MSGKSKRRNSPQFVDEWIWNTETWPVFAKWPEKVSIAMASCDNVIEAGKRLAGGQSEDPKAQANIIKNCPQGVQNHIAYICEEYVDSEINPKGREIPKELRAVRDLKLLSRCHELVNRRHRYTVSEWLTKESHKLEEAVLISMGIEPFPLRLFRINVECASVDVFDFQNEGGGILVDFFPVFETPVCAELLHRFERILTAGKAGLVKIDASSTHVEFWKVIAYLHDKGFELWKPLKELLLGIRQDRPDFPSREIESKTDSDTQRNEQVKGQRLTQADVARRLEKRGFRFSAAKSRVNRAIGKDLNAGKDGKIAESDALIWIEAQSPRETKLDPFDI